MILSRYGYHGTRHIQAMFRAEIESHRDTEYIATVLWSIGRLIGGENYSIPTYEDVINPKPVDNRSSGAIISGLIEKLGKGVTSDAGSNGTVPGGGETGT